MHLARPGYSRAQIYKINGNLKGAVTPFVVDPPPDPATPLRGRGCATGCQSVNAPRRSPEASSPSAQNINFETMKLVKVLTWLNDIYETVIPIRPFLLEIPVTTHKWQRFSSGAAPPRTSSMAAPDVPITQNPNEKWMIVTARRNRRRGKPISQLHHTTDALIRGGSAGPWTPIDTEMDPERESNLLQKMRSSLKRVEASKFYLDLLQQLQSPSPIREGLDKIRKASDDADLTMVVYGIGSIESDGPPRLQLSLAILLADRIGIGRTEIFDPVLSSTECRVIEALGCAVLSFNDCGRRAVHGPTLFFMPHCEAGLYDGLLEANWRPPRLNRMAVLGNSFRAYAAHASLVGRPTWGRPVPYLMEAERLVSEVEVGTGGDEGVFFRAFQDTSWHFFDLDLDMDLPHL